MKAQVKFFSSLTLLLGMFALVSCIIDVNGTKPLDGKVVVRFNVSQGSRSTTSPVRGLYPAEGETVEWPVPGSDLCLSATLAPSDDAPLRGVVPLAPGTRLWIGAYNGGGSLVDSLNCTVDGNGNLVSGVDGLTVDAGEYTFVAYSYNSPTALPAYSATITNINPSGADLLWGKTAATTVSVGSSNLIPLTLNYKFPKLSAAIEAVDLDGSTALSLSEISTVTVSPDSLANLKVVDGQLSGSAKAIPSSIGGWPTVPALTYTSSSITLYTGRTNTVTIHISSIKIG
ncbi:MAG: hypothetical protein LBH19_10530, partial [Dysgonamonadaceae bacterium]|nr:hypothetical protein [Dysgonamonadaceae bacterium]